jgi:hypothetical protein
VPMGIWYGPGQQRQSVCSTRKQVSLATLFHIMSTSYTKYYISWSRVHRACM